MTNKKYYLVQDGDPSDGTICNIFKKLLGVDDYKIKNGVSFFVIQCHTIENNNHYIKE